MSDKEILRLYLQRDESAISETKKVYGRFLRHFSKTIVGDERDAEECENDVYLAAWRSIPPNAPETMQPYLAALCRRISVNRLQEKIAQKRGLGVNAAAFEELEEIVAVGGPDPADLTALKDLLEGFLRGLKRKERVAFLQRYWHARSISEIAKELSMSESGVKMLLSRTREKLKTYLNENGYAL